MTAAVLPTLAAAALGGVLVARPRTTVVHVARPDRALTPGGRLRRGASPVCGTRGRAWPTSTDPARRLCRRCAARLRGVDPAAAATRAVLTEQQLSDLLDQASDDHQLHLAVMALTTSAVPGALYRLSSRVHAARDRLHPEQARARYPHRRTA